MSGAVQAWDVSGEGPVHVPARISQAGVDEGAERAHVFTERGVYRPGHTVHFRSVLRWRG